MQHRLARHVSILRIIFGVIWAIDAALKWLPDFARDFMDYATQGAQGQPGWLVPWFNLWSGFFAVNPRLFALLVAIAETVIALALLIGFARRAIYLGAAGFSLLIWAIPQGFGGPYSSTSTDIGVGIIYALVFFALYGLERLAKPPRWAVDTYIVKRLPWWALVANP